MEEQKERTEEERAEPGMRLRAAGGGAGPVRGDASEKDEQRALEEKLAAMQAKVVRGGTNLLDQEQRLLEEARRREEKLAKIAAAEAEQARRIKELEDLNTITAIYKTIEEEIESKARKIHKLHEAYQRCVVDLKDLDLEFERERENLLDTVRALTRQIKLKNLVLDSYVPRRSREDYDFGVMGRPIRDVAVDRAQHAGIHRARDVSRRTRSARRKAAR